MWFAVIRSLILARLIAWFLRRLESRDPVADTTPGALT